MLPLGEESRPAGCTRRVWVVSRVLELGRSGEGPRAGGVGAK